MGRSRTGITGLLISDGFVEGLNAVMCRHRIIAM